MDFPEWHNAELQAEYAEVDLACLASNLEYRDNSDVAHGLSDRDGRHPRRVRQFRWRLSMAMMVVLVDEAQYPCEICNYSFISGMLK